MNSRKANLEVMPEAYVSKEEIMTFRMYVDVFKDDRF